MKWDNYIVLTREKTSFIRLRLEENLTVGVLCAWLCDSRIKKAYVVFESNYTHVRYPVPHFNDSSEFTTWFLKKNLILSETTINSDNFILTEAKFLDIYLHKK